MARRAKGAPVSTWLVRGAIGLALGTLVGFGVGAAAVRVLQPPVVTSDNAANDATKKPRRGPAQANASAAQNDNDDSNAPAAEPVAREAQAGTPVPKLVGLEEGDARLAISGAGLTVGSVTFRSSAARAGTVLSSSPAFGENVVPASAVNLTLSDGKPRPDSLGGADALPSHSGTYR